MSISQFFSVSCSNCNKFQAPDHGETAAEAIELAKDNGWRCVRVSNGSNWEICPRCLPKFVDCPDATFP